MWRSLFELSSMANNNEVAIHTEEEVTREKFPDAESYWELLEEQGVRCKYRSFSSPALLFSREINPETEPELINPNDPPPITHTIDELFKLYTSFSIYLTKINMSPENAILHWITYSYYDCMSAGASKVSLAMVREMISMAGLGMDLEIYGCATIGEFLKEISEIPRIDPRLIPQGTANLLLP